MKASIAVVFRLQVALLGGGLLGIPWWIWHPLMRHPWWSMGLAAAMLWSTIAIDLVIPPRLYTVTWLSLLGLAVGLPPGVHLIAGLILLGWITGVIWQVAWALAQRDPTHRWEPVWEGLVAVTAIALLHVL